MLQRLTKLSSFSQFLISIALVVLAAAGCFTVSAYIDHRVVALILLLTVSLIAIVFDIVPVLTAAATERINLEFLFIQPKFTFHIGTAEDAFLFLMYFVIALINGVLTNRIRRSEQLVREKERKNSEVV